ncbi:MAG: uracil-DNA glycosylase [Candidatus Dadabacteria bacterium]|nr:uracil-DNA glycosylase [Candidatus Dadabacteria bacterium]NIS07311.1 uracil-DNA glycosylase [Candidatus Dadabacteria bacterium]NIY20949.1 uracil-DNA glycosylase [Candidatus Dadabacteria bacterium]
MSNNREDIIVDLKKYFRQQKELGIEYFYMTPVNRDSGVDEKTSDISDGEAKLNEDTHQMNLLNSTAKKMTLDEISEEIGDCTRCKLHEGRTNIVFGEGNANARLVFVGEGPGRDEDEQGRPFVGRAGKLLTKIVNAMGLQRTDVFICNVVKCRPPENRNPEADEMTTCGQFLTKQLISINPEVIVCLGSIASKYLLNSKGSLGSMRGKFHTYGNSKLLVTYHPAALLRNPNFKKPLWEDMKIVLKELQLPIPGD